MIPRSLRATITILGAVALSACDLITGNQLRMAEQTVALFSTPKFIRDFDNPGPSVRAFLEHYDPLLSRADQTILIFAVGNSQHVLSYKGPAHMADSVEWARFTGLHLTDSRRLTYAQIAGIVQSIKAVADTLGIRIKVFDQVDGGAEFVREFFKLNFHTECFPRDFDSFNIRGILVSDTVAYASAPDGIAAGTQCGTFLVDQVGHYVRDLDFDGILYGNQLGTRGRWLPDAGPGYTDAEAEAIRSFFQYSKQVLGGRELMWFDSYQPTRIERDTYSMPSDAYESMDYLLAAGFSVISSPGWYIDNLRSKLSLRDRTVVLASLDYVDPWYEYNSMEAYPAETANLERVAIQHRYLIGGVLFFANDDHGNPVPRRYIESFAHRYFDGVWPFD